MTETLHEGFTGEKPPRLCIHCESPESDSITLEEFGRDGPDCDLRRVSDQETVGDDVRDVTAPVEADSASGAHPPLGPIVLENNAFDDSRGGGTDDAAADVHAAGPLGDLVDAVPIRQLDVPDRDQRIDPKRDVLADQAAVEGQAAATHVESRPVLGLVGDHLTPRDAHIEVPGIQRPAQAKLARIAVETAGPGAAGVDIVTVAVHEEAAGVHIPLVRGPVAGEGAPLHGQFQRFRFDLKGRRGDQDGYRLARQRIHRKGLRDTAGDLAGIDGATLLEGPIAGEATVCEGGIAGKMDGAAILERPVVLELSSLNDHRVTIRSHIDGRTEIGGLLEGECRDGKIKPIEEIDILEAIDAGILRFVLAGQHIAGKAAVVDVHGALLRRMESAARVAIEGAAVEAERGRRVAENSPSAGVYLSPLISQGEVVLEPVAEHRPQR